MSDRGRLEARDDGRGHIGCAGAWPVSTTTPPDEAPASSWAAAAPPPAAGQAPAGIDEVRCRLDQCRTSSRSSPVSPFASLRHGSATYRVAATVARSWSQTSVGARTREPVARPDDPGPSPLGAPWPLLPFGDDALLPELEQPAAPWSGAGPGATGGVATGARSRPAWS